MFHAYARTMDGLSRLCMILSAFCLVVITLIIPWGVFTRYVLGYGSAWPEPMAVLLMIVFSFFAGALCYRENMHIAVLALPSSLGPAGRLALGWTVELAMAGTNLFVLLYGLDLVRITWHQVIAEFPTLSVGLTYLPVPLGGAITILFALEKLWRGRFFEAPGEGAVARVETD